MNPSPHSPRRRRGGTLIEALVALGVLSLGALALVGVQGSLRAQAEGSRQLSAAVRLAQEALEEARTLAAVAPQPEASGPGAALADQPLARTTEPITLHSPSDPTAYRLTRRVDPLQAASGDAVRIRVEWTDRAAQPQHVDLFSVVARVSPDLAATLAVAPLDGQVLLRPLGRHAGIPPSARPLSRGRSSFRPPGAPASEVWVFDHQTGQARLCQTGIHNPMQALSEGDLHCGNDQALTVSGYLSLDLPTSLQPAALSMQVVLLQSAPEVAVRACHLGPLIADRLPHRAFHCAVPLHSAQPQTWSGRLQIGPVAAPTPQPTDVAIAWQHDDDTAHHLRVCRYADPPLPDLPVALAPAQGADAVGEYREIGQPLRHQNLLLIPAGDGVQTRACPAPETRQHQPTPPLAAIATP